MKISIYNLKNTFRFVLCSINDSKNIIVRKFGKFSGKKEIESIVVDNELGYVYYSDEGKGVRKYYAHPDSSSAELALFARKKVKEDHEGLSIFKNPDGTGFILLSDQQANQFNVYPREGQKDNQHKHGLIKKIHANSIESDGSEVLHLPLNNKFKKGIFVAMSSASPWHDWHGTGLVVGCGGIGQSLLQELGPSSSNG